MKAQRTGNILDGAAAYIFPGDIDLWPSIQPQLRPRRQPAHVWQARLVAGVKISVITCTIFAAIFAISPEVRAQTGAVLRKIGELVFTTALPFPQRASTPSVAPAPQFPWVTHSRGMTLDDARATVPFALKMPTWVPADFYADDQVGVYTTKLRICDCPVAWSLSKVWIRPFQVGNSASAGRVSISLTIHKEQGAPWVSGPVVADLATLEELNINGRPTALFGPEGVMPAEPRLLGLSKTLMWTEGGATFSLRGTPGVPIEDLIHMAESIP